MATNKGVTAASKTVETDVEVVAMKRAPKLLDRVSETLCNFFDAIIRTGADPGGPQLLRLKVADVAK